jgi:DNA-binding LacI/PurR family transcriptional regulator
MRRHLPLVFVDQTPAAGIPSVNVGDRSGARAAAQHLLDLGHRRIAIVTVGHGGEYGVLTDPLASAGGHTERQRLLGWLDALTDGGVTPTVIRQPHAESGQLGYESGKILLAHDEPPTGVLCFSDAIARGLVEALLDSGLNVPTDVSVVGFDDNPIARRVRPMLTTVHQDVDAKGRIATTTLLTSIERAKNGSTGRSRHVQLPTELILRDSTARPPRRRAGR